MKTVIRSVILFAFFLFFGCIQHNDREVTIETNEDVNDLFQVEVHHAKGFELVYTADYIKVLTHSFGENQPFRDSLLLPLNPSTPLNQRTKQSVCTINSAVCQSVTHLSFLHALKAVDLVKGVCGLRYVKDTEITDRLEKNGAVELCLGDQLLEESLLNISPDILFAYPFGNEFGEAYTEKGINTLLIAEYLEESQLARVEWIKLFGVLIGKGKEASDLFDTIEEEYKTLKSSVESTGKTFIMNLPFKDSWFMPSANSVGTELITDAGLTFFYSNEQGTENNMRPKEVIWEDGTKADYWIIIAQRKKGFSLVDLIAEEEAYGAFKSVKNNQVIFCNTAEVDYFARGVIEPDVILKDLLLATGNEIEHEPVYFFKLQ